MKIKGGIRKISIAAVIIIAISISAYHFLTSSFFITRYVLPAVGRNIGVPISAKTVSLSPAGSSIEICGLSLGRTDSPFFKADKLRLKMAIFSALGGNFEIYELNIQNPSINIESYANGSSNITFAEEGSSGKSQSTGQTAAPRDEYRLSDFRIDNLEISRLNLSYTDYRRDKTIQTRAELADFSISSSNFRLGKDAIVRSSGQIRMKSGDSVDIVGGKIAQQVNFRLNKDFIPEMLDSKTEITDLKGTVNNASLESKKLSSECVANLVGKDLEISKFELSGSAGDEAESRIRSTGKISFQPFSAKFDIDISPLSSELLNIIAETTAGISPGNTSLLYKGSLSCSESELLSCGSFTFSNRQSKELSLGLKGTYDMKIYPDSSRAMINALDTRISINGVENGAISLEKPVAIDWSGKGQSDIPAAESANFRIRLDNISLPLINNFIPQKSRMRFNEGLFSSDISALVEDNGQKIRIGGALSVNELDAEVDGQRIRGISSSLEIGGSELTSFSNLTMEKISLSVIARGKRVFLLNGSFEGNIGDGSFKTEISRLSMDEKTLLIMPEDMRKSFPLKSFSVGAKISASRKASANATGISGHLSVSRAVSATPIDYISTAESTAELDFSLSLGKDSISDARLALTVGNFICGKASIDAEISSHVKRIFYEKKTLEIAELQGKLALSGGGTLNLSAEKPFSLDLGSETIRLSPPLEVNAGLSDIPMEKLHCFFDPSYGFESLGGKGGGGIFCRFGDNFSISAAKTEIRLNDFSFSSAGWTFSNLKVAQNAELGFEGWDRLNVKSCETTFFSADTPIATIVQDAKFDFSAGTGSIGSEIRMLDEKISGILPKDLAEDIGFARKMNLASSSNSFSYDLDGFQTAGRLIASGFVPKGGGFPESDIKASYGITRKDGVLEFKECLIENFIGNSRTLNISMQGTYDLALKKGRLDVISEQSDIGLIAESFMEEEKKEDTPSPEKPAMEKPAKEPGPNPIRDYDVEASMDLRDISYGESIKAGLTASIALKDGIFSAKNISGKINEAQAGGSLIANLRDSSSLAYEADLKVGRLDLGPVVNPFVQSKNPFKGVLDGLELSAQSPGGPFENPAAKITGTLKASLSELSIPTALRDKSLTAKLILTPIEAIASIGKYVPTRYIPKELSDAATIFTDYFQNFDNVVFSSGEISATAKNGIIRVERCNFKGTSVKELSLTATIVGADGGMQAKTRTTIGKLVIPIRLKGTFAAPSPEYNLILPDFLEANAGNLLSVENLGEFLKTTGDKGKKTGEKTIDILKNILQIDGGKDKKQK